MKKLLLLTLLTAFSLTSFGQTSPEDLIKSFFTAYCQNSNKAIDDLYATNLWISRIKDGIESMKKEVNSYSVDYVGK